MGFLIQNIIDSLKCIAIIGTCKNAGKTTVLNHILTNCDDKERFGLTSIGLDGEGLDLISGQPKPRIYVRSGTCVATAQSLLDLCDCSREIIKCTGLHTPLGEVVVFRARSDGYVCLAGPSMNKHISKLCMIFKKIGCTKIILDGALDRRSAASPGIADGCILATGACLSDEFQTVVDDTAHIVNMLSLPEFQNRGFSRRFHSILHSCDVGVVKDDGTILLVKSAITEKSAIEVAGLLERAQFVLIKGVLVKGFVEGVLRMAKDISGIKFVIEDGTKAFINDNQYAQIIARGATIEVLQKINLSCVAVNPATCDGTVIYDGSLLDAISCKVKVPVIDVVGDANRSTATRDETRINVPVIDVVGGGRV